MVSITEKGADVMTKFGKAITDISYFLNEDDDKEKDDFMDEDRKLAGKICTSSMLSQGRHEIEAARQRLAAAKTQASAASKNMEAAKLMMENAKSLLESSSKEVDAAKKCLSEAEKRWEVIEIEEEESDDSLNNGGSHKKKKRKVSDVSPQGSNSNNNSAGNNASSVVQDEIAVVTPGWERAVGASTATTATSSSSSTSNNVSRVVVEGCGMYEMNGMYTREPGVLNEGAPVYTKRGLGQGKLCKHAIYRGLSSGMYKWYLGHWEDGRPSKRLYTSHRNGSSLTPSTDGWMAIPWEVPYPAPTCRIIYDNDTTDGGVQS